MIKIQEVVKDIVYNEEEALYSLCTGYMNLSAYSKRIQKEVEKRTKKDVKVSGIVVALSRIQKNLKNIHPLVQDIKINNITAKSPLSEIVFEKTPLILSKLSSMYEKVKTVNDDFLTMTLSTSEVTVICSDRIKESILKHFKDEPRMIENGLASIGISIDPKYYPMSNITFSLIRRIAKKRIPLAETITTHTEIIFIFPQKSLSQVLELFSS
jgi:hypothetical protein